MKKVLIFADLHCGSVVGITPPQHQTGEHRQDQLALWETATGMVEKFKDRFGNVDILIVNGDCLDGKSSRWGGTDVITTKIRTQIDMAAEFILDVGATDIVMTRGTPYHTGAEEDWEDYLARDVSAAIKDHAFLEIEGVNFSVKHTIGSSTIPHGRYTAVARSKLWDTIWAVEKEQHPLSDVLIRSHTHYFGYAGNASFLGLTTPALQGLGSKFGARMCEGTVDFGIVYFICDKGEYKWGWDIAIVDEQKDEVLKF